ncbi:DUF1249 domain-containing protein [Inmirania thermothiophila]|uniref:DUF1249 domain-containing protein n=1 Tax=Inmirania thermothiophila TaxID=1750597 RepID=UPI001FEC3A79|nr:DUF1249 domain-containing protein [Inmirania thermothiophila]
MARACPALGDYALQPPGSFAGLMGLYGHNWRQLLVLAPGLAELSGVLVAEVPGLPPLYLRVRERTPYTTRLLLTHLFPEADGWRADPALPVRVYHDARLAEVEPPGRTARNPRWALEQRWRLNHFLDRWLAYSIASGYRFAAGAAVEAAAAERLEAALA